MGDEPSTSKDADDTQVETQPWTRDLKYFLHSPTIK